MINSAATLFHQQGYANTGAREVATAAGVPQGSFTNHFRSKEALGVAALDSYVARLTEAMDATLQDRSRSARERLLAYFDLIGERLAATGWEQGCLIADLAAETPAHSEILRDRLSDVMSEQVSMFAAVLAESVSDQDEGDLASFIVSAWHGTLLRMKVERGPAPLRRFRRVLHRLLTNS